MWKAYIKYFFILDFYLIFCGNIIAQEECNDKLLLARQLFESGQIEQIPFLLDSCINNGFTKEQKVQAYHLLMQTYLFDYNQDKAQEVMLRFLKEFPNYEVKASDALEIKELYKKFNILPNWGLGIIAGTNASIIQPTEYFTASPQNEVNKKYALLPGWNVGLHFEKYFGKHFGIATGARYTNFRFSNTEQLDNGNIQIDYKESAYCYSFPLTFFFSYWEWKFSPFIFAGAEFGHFSVIQSDTKRRIINPDVTNKMSSRDILDYRNKDLFWANAGLGVKYKVHKGSVKLWAGFNYNLNNYIKKEKRYDDLDYIVNFQHIDDDILIHHVFLNVTYSRLLYKIKYKKKNEPGI